MGEAEQEIDLVYLWYGAKEPPPGVDKCRACDNGELYWSLRSVDKFAPWFRSIHVLVNDDAAIPEWLSEHSKVKIVRLSSFIPAEILPLNNSASIEMWLYRVPDLSERFVYSNDDMFLGRAVAPRDFFDGNGRMVCRYTECGDVMGPANDLYDGQLQCSRRLLGDSYCRYPHHNMDGYLKSVIEDFWKTYPDEARRSGSFRYRVSDQLQRDVFSGFAVKTGRGVRRLVDRMVRVKRWLGLSAYESMYVSISDSTGIGWLEVNRPKMFCLNDDERSTDADRANITSVLERMLA